MSGFVIHSIPGSPYGRAALVALEEKNAAYRLRAVVPGTLQTTQHLALHPFGRIPVMEHDDYRLYEVQAIVRYIDRALPGAALTPTDLKAAGRMDQLMNINDWYLFQGVARVIVFHRVVGPRVMGLKADESAIAAAMPAAHKVFTELARLLGEQAFFAGGSLSLADIMLGPQLDMFRMTPEWEPLTAEHGNIRAWLDRMNARPSMAATTWERVAAMN